MHYTDFQQRQLDQKSGEELDRNKRCAVCGKHLGGDVEELIDVGNCHPHCAEQEGQALVEDAERNHRDW